MSLSAATGSAAAPSGSEAATAALAQAFERLGSEKAEAAFVFASKDYAMPEVTGALFDALKNTPVWGFNTQGQFHNLGAQADSVVVALLAGGEFQMQAEWWPGFNQDSLSVTQKMLATLPPTPPAGLLVVADGLTGNGQVLCEQLGGYPVAGCLTGGGGGGWAQPFQVGGQHAGTGGLAAAAISGRIKIGAGTSHGWQPVGKYFQITQAEGPWIRTLDHLPAAESYARLFRISAHDWAFPPLNELVRVYPLGIVHGLKNNLRVRAPLRVEVDGSFRMGVAVPQGSTGHLMVGSLSNCLEAARQASREARQALEGARPVLALLLVDVAWKTIFEARPAGECAAVREVLGMDLPVAGGYTIGQISAGAPHAELLDAHVQVVVFGEPV